jgi:hypothetical protein
MVWTVPGRSDIYLFTTTARIDVASMVTDRHLRDCFFSLWPAGLIRLKQCHRKSYNLASRSSDQSDATHVRIFGLVSFDCKGLRALFVMTAHISFLDHELKVWLDQHSTARAPKGCTSVPDKGKGNNNGNWSWSWTGNENENRQKWRWKGNW